MKNSFNIFFQLVIIVCIGILSGCAASKSAFSPTGSWNYTVKNTPNGDTKGIMTLTKEGDAYSGNFQTREHGTFQMQNITMEGKTLTTSFSVRGATFRMNGLFDGDSFTGKISSEYGTFDMVADRTQ